jgi:hypothetical protein
MTARVTILTMLTAIAAGSSYSSTRGATKDAGDDEGKHQKQGISYHEQPHGTVSMWEGNHLVVRMTNGASEFKVPESRKFTIDGRDLTVHELKPGTQLSATVTTTTTPITDRTTTVGTGTVWWVAGKTVVITLPNGENRTFTVKDDYKFSIEGNKSATVSDLKKGMRISAQKIVEEPRTEIASDTVVTGQAPRSK